MEIVKYTKQKLLDEDVNCILCTEADYIPKEKRLLNFSAVLLLSRGEENYEIIRYDTAHGRCHVHRFYIELGHKGDLLLDNRVDDKSFREFRMDIAENYKKYVEAYIRKWL